MVHKAYLSAKNKHEDVMHSPAITFPFFIPPETLLRIVFVVLLEMGTVNARSLKENELVVETKKHERYPWLSMLSLLALTAASSAGEFVDVAFSSMFSCSCVDAAVD